MMQVPLIGLSVTMILLGISQLGGPYPILSVIAVTAGALMFARLTK